MNTQSLKDSWSQMKEALKQKYSKLTEDDLKYAAGKEEDLYNRIQKKLGVTRQEVDKIFQEQHEYVKTKFQKTGGKP